MIQLFSLLIILSYLINNKTFSYIIKYTNHKLNKIFIYKNIFKNILSLKDDSNIDSKDSRNLLIDINKLEESEQKRLAYLQKISLEADQMIKDAGFKIDDTNDFGIMYIIYMYMYIPILCIHFCYYW